MNHHQLASARVASGLTQQDLADRCGVNVRTIYRLEAGKNVASATVFKVMDALDLVVVPCRVVLWANNEIDVQELAWPPKTELIQTWEGLRK